MASPAGSPVAVKVREQPARPSGADNCKLTALPARPACRPGQDTLTCPWTCQVNVTFCVCAAGPASVTVSG